MAYRWQGRNVNLKSKICENARIAQYRTMAGKLNVYRRCAKQNYYISEKLGVLLPNDKENGSYQQAPVQKKFAQGVYKVQIFILNFLKTSIGVYFVNQSMLFFIYGNIFLWRICFIKMFHKKIFVFSKIFLYRYFIINLWQMQFL